MPLMPAIKSTKELLADSLYGGDDNYHVSAELGVEFVSPVMGRSGEDSISLTDFGLSDKGKIISCPHGLAPARTKKRKKKGLPKILQIGFVTMARYSLKVPVPGFRGLTIKSGFKG